MRAKVTLTLLLLASTCADAAGAPWYKWMNLEDHTIICNQLSPGEGWVQYQGPFSESTCRKPGLPQ